MAPAPITAWAVRLGASNDDVKGTLSLQDDALVFAMSEAELRILLTDIRKAKRNRGSPILVVEHTQNGALARHAFFFAKPPPVKPPEGKSKRKTARQGIVYLQRNNIELKPVLEEWEKAIKDARASA